MTRAERVVHDQILLRLLERRRRERDERAGKMPALPGLPDFRGVAVSRLTTSDSDCADRDCGSPAERPAAENNGGGAGFVHRFPAPPPEPGHEVQGPRSKGESP